MGRQSLGDQNFPGFLVTGGSFAPDFKASGKIGPLLYSLDLGRVRQAVVNNVKRALDQAEGTVPGLCLPNYTPRTRLSR